MSVNNSTNYRSIRYAGYNTQERQRQNELKELQKNELPTPSKLKKAIDWFFPKRPQDVSDFRRTGDAYQADSGKHPMKSIEAGHLVTDNDMVKYLNYLDKCLVTAAPISKSGENK